MMTKLVNIARKNLILGALVKAAVLVSTYIINIWDEVTGTLRLWGFNGGKYKDILLLKNKYAGKRCFIICTGPSLTVEDVNLLKDEYTFAMNSFCLLKDKTEFRPKFYGCIDLGVFNKLAPKIEDYCQDQVGVFISDRIKRHCKVNKKWHVLPINVAYHTYDRWMKGKFWCKFSNDCYRTVYDMYSVTHALIQIAAYMGFKEIYLVGADCNFPKGEKVHFQDYGVLDTTIDTARERNISGYEEIKKRMRECGFTVYNATRGGALEVFERVNLDAILGK